MRTTEQHTVDGPTRYFINSVAKAFQILEAFKGHGSRLTLSNLALHSGLNKATARRITLTLCDLGYVQQIGSLQFTLTPKVLDLAGHFLQAISLPDIAEPFLTDLAAVTHESTNLAIRDGAEVLYVFRIAAAQRILAVNLRVGSRLPAHATSLGKALLMGTTRQQLLEILGDPPWPQYTGSTRSDPDRLLADLQEARRLGCALADGELEVGLRSIAAPIRDGTGRIDAAINISTHSLQVPLEQLLGPMREQLVKTADAISNALGYRRMSYSER